jgi:hypothetical protein
MRTLAVLSLVAMLWTPAFADSPEPPPTFAVGLRAKDALADKIALSLEGALRDAGKKKSAAYRAKGTRKDLVAALVAADCMITLPGCAGTKLDVDYVLVGVLETRGHRFILDLDVIRVSSGKRVRSIRDLASASTTAQKWARTVFARIVDDATGDLLLSSNAARGVVVVDGQPVTELFERHATVTNLSLGTHALEIRSDGYKPYTGDMTIDGTTKLSILLELLSP